jgi:glycosyltransferase involved in cell wall biosynthesis
MKDFPPSPFFTVIIPTYNRSKAVVDAVKSVLDQTYTDFEVIVVDDGSTDETAEFLRRLSKEDDRIIYVYQENQERSAARNNGIEHSKGKFICFLDSDDQYEPDHLSSFFAILKRNKFKPALYYCLGKSIVNGEKQIIKSAAYPVEQDALEFVLTETTIGTVFVCLNKEILEKYRFNEAISIGEDRELWSRILVEYPLVPSLNHTVIINDHGDRTVDIANISSAAESLITTKYIVKRLGARLSPKVGKKIISASYFKLAQTHLANKHRVKAILWTIWSIVLCQDKYTLSRIVFAINAAGLGFVLPSRFKRV